MYAVIQLGHQTRDGLTRLLDPVAVGPFPDRDSAYLWLLTATTGSGWAEYSHAIVPLTPPEKTQ